MSEIIERVAKVLFAVQSGGPGDIGETTEIVWHHLNEHARNLWFDIARSAIEAMREPTAEMAKQGNGKALDDGAHDCEVPMADVYRAMIDAALK